MEWIKTEEKTPQDGQIVLVADNISKFISLGKYQEEEDTFLLMNMFECEYDSYPTHWLPLPNYPNKDC